MKKISLFLSLLIYSLNIYSQNYVLFGNIEFECKTNMHKLMKEESSEWFENAKDQIPKYTIIYNNLSFDTCKTIYYPGKEPAQKPPFWGDEGIPEDYIYTDFCSQKHVAQKEVFDQTFLVIDSIRNIKWKMSNEEREIAGYKCKKATAIIMDSVYIIAFYTEQIICPGGPASIQGLPGMILGMVIPRLYTTWFATQVTVLKAPQTNLLVPPKKGTKSTRILLIEKLRETFKEWGKTYIISFSI